MRTNDASPRGGNDHALEQGLIPKAPEAGPVRTCVGCRRRDARNVLVRVVLDPGPPPRAVVDVHRDLPGRGAWIHQAHACVDNAERRHALRRALRADGAVQVEALRAWMEHQLGQPQDAAKPPHDLRKRVGS